MDLQPSIAQASSKSPLPLILLGLLTSALALAAVWGIGQVTEDFNLMSLWVLWIIPVGALLVGVGAGSGYGIGSWWTGVRISRRLLWAVVFLQLGAYFLAQYLEYLHLMNKLSVGTEEPGFWAYFDWATRQIQFKGEHDSDYGDPMGAWGYAFRVLEIGGFVLGGLVVPLALKSKPYCDECQIYMRTRTLVWLPASAPMRKIKRKDVAGQQAWTEENEATRQAGADLLQSIWDAIGQRKPDLINSLVSRYGPAAKETSKLPSRIQVTLSTCPGCHKGRLSAATLTGQGNDLHQQDLGGVDLSSDLSQALTDKIT